MIIRYKKIVFVGIAFIFLSTNHIYGQNNISFLKKIKYNDKKLAEDYFWHLNFFNLDKLLQSSTKNIQVVIIDGEIHERNSACGDLINSSKNLTLEDREFVLDASYQKSKNLSLFLMQKKINFEQIIKKYHADITMSLIRQIAPQVKISVIPTLSSQTGASKHDLYLALKKALKMNPDILHLGIQVIDFDPTLLVDKKLVALLKKFKCVVASSGNYGYQNLQVGFPANCPFVISVGSFTQEGDNYPISDFCQTGGGVDFVMPGENLVAKIWIDEFNDYFFIPVSGTSMASALMTGLIANLLEKQSNAKLKAMEIKKILKKRSTYLDASWLNNIRYGIPIF